MPPKTYIECPSCGEKSKFTLSLMEGERYFAITCGFCDKPVRPIEAWKLSDAKKKNTENIAFPFGKKYKGVIISTMNRSEDIKYLEWVKTTEMWGILRPEIREVIGVHLGEYYKKLEMGIKKDDSELPEPKVLFNPLKDFKKKIDIDSLPI